MHRAEVGDRVIKGLIKEIERYEKTLAELSLLPKDNYCFEKLGIDYLFVDEAHTFKNLAYTTHYNRVKGLGPKAGSKMAFAFVVCNNIYAQIA